MASDSSEKNSVNNMTECIIDKTPENETSKKYMFNVPECRTETVVVYLDRAEVSRVLETHLTQGNAEIIFKDLSPFVDKDSLRVEGRGPATINEVTFQTKHLTIEESLSKKQENEELQNSLATEQKHRKVLKARRHRLQKQRTLLDSFADSFTVKELSANQSTKPKDSDSENRVVALNPLLLEGMSGFFNLYEMQAEKLDSGLETVDQELETVNQKILSIERNLAERNAKTLTKEASELSVLLEVSEDCDIELVLSYVVKKAKWTPKYDIRVFSNDGVLKIMYYGMIQQSTGEDWNDAKLCLSTAMPSVGGTIPDLGTQRLSFKVIRVAQKYATRAFKGVRAASSFRMKKADSFTAQNEESYCLEECSDMTPEMYVPEAEVKESITSTIYEIARRATIPCDNATHKVSVAIIDLTPRFEYESVPKKATQAFLKARVKNTSPYALLAGPTNIFLDNNFVAKAELKAVSPLEEFTCSLGVDPSIRVAYKPLQKIREQAGMISKVVNTTYKQIIEVKNTHQEPIRLLLFDHLPLSTEEKIRVTLIEPLIKHPEKFDKTKPVRLNQMNNIEWELEIEPNETKEIVLRYLIEHPANQQIDMNVTHCQDV